MFSKKKPAVAAEGAVASPPPAAVVTAAAEEVGPKKPSMLSSMKSSMGKSVSSAAARAASIGKAAEEPRTTTDIALHDSDSDDEGGSGGGGGRGGGGGKGEGGVGKKSHVVTLPSMLKGRAPGTTPRQSVYAAVGRQKPMTNGSTTSSEAYTADVPVIAVELGRKMLARKPTPGWDDICCEGWRAIKLPVHDMHGCNSYVIVFGGEFDPKRAQAIVERFALMLGPMIDGQLLDGDDSTRKDAAAPVTLDAAAALDMHKVRFFATLTELLTGAC